MKAGTSPQEISILPNGARYNLCFGETVEGLYIKILSTFENLESDLFRLLGLGGSDFDGIYNKHEIEWFFFWVFFVMCGWTK